MEVRRGAAVERLLMTAIAPQRRPRSQMGESIEGELSADDIDYSA